jgi:hypothetical protein
MPDPLEVDLFDNGELILAFDGRVLEIFGQITAHTDIHPHTNDSWRVYVNQLHVDVSRDDKKGLYRVALKTPASGFSKEGTMAFDIDDAGLRRLMPLLEALKNAMAT